MLHVSALTKKLTLVLIGLTAALFIAALPAIAQPAYADTYKLSTSGDGNADIYPTNKTPEGYYKWDGYVEGEIVSFRAEGDYGYLLESVKVINDTTGA